MHTTTVTMKDGRVLQGNLNLFRPIDGYMRLMQYDEDLYFKDMVSAITEGERIGVVYEDGKAVGPKIGDLDEIQRAREYLVLARKHGWDNLASDSPKQDWE